MRFGRPHFRFWRGGNAVGRMMKLLGSQCTLPRLRTERLSGAGYSRSVKPQRGSGDLPVLVEASTPAEAEGNGYKIARRVYPRCAVHCSVGYIYPISPEDAVIDEEKTR